MTTAVIRTLPADHVTPVRAYAALRAQSAGRSSFLFESARPGDGWGRHAIVGYRARAECIYPSSFDPFEMLAQDLAEPETAEGLAASVSQALVGFIAYDVVLRMHDVEPWPDEPYLARMMRGATVVVFDNLTQTMTIAGASQGAVNRCAWEMAHGPAMSGLPALDPQALPEWLDPTMPDEKYAVSVARAAERIAAGDPTELVLARTYRAPLRNADPFDMYRALRLLSPAQHLYFLDFAESQFAPGLTIAGASPETMVRIERDPATGARQGDVSAVDALRSAFRASRTTGVPTSRAAAASRLLEAGSRRIHGGAVGYFGPEGSAELALGLQSVWVENGQFEVTAAIRVAPGSAPEVEAQRTLDSARSALAAIRAAHDAQREREIAAEKKAAAAEKAAAEKAAAEKAAAEKAAAEQPAGEVAAESEASDDRG